MTDDDHVFPQRLLRGLGLLKQSSTGPHLVPQAFGWDENGGYWATTHGQPKPSAPPPGSSTSSGEWIKSFPYGRRMPPADLLHGVLIDEKNKCWIWYPLPKDTPQWMNDQIWAMHSDMPPTAAPTGQRPVISPFLSLTTPASLPAPAAMHGNSWVATAAGYWIWVYMKPAPALEAP